MSRETTRLIRDGEKQGWGYGSGGRRKNIYTYSYTVTTRMTPALRWAVMRAILMHTCQPVQFTSIKFLKIIILGGYGHTGKWIQENVIFMRFCCCFKLSKKIEKLSNQQPMNAITKCTLAGLC